MVTLRSRREAGYTYLAVLFMVAGMGLLAAGAAEVWATATKREREKELLFIGNQFREAIGRYYEKSPGAKVYPQTLQELVEDKRFPQYQRHLRRIYRDPMSGTADWALVLEQGRIVGVHSKSEEEPLKTANFRTRDFDFAGRSSYAEWKFTYRPGTEAPGAPGAAAGAAAGGPGAPAGPGVPGAPGMGGTPAMGGAPGMGGAPMPPGVPGGPAAAGAPGVPGAPGGGPLGAPFGGSAPAPGAGPAGTPTGESPTARAPGGNPGEQACAQGLFAALRACAAEPQERQSACFADAGTRNAECLSAAQNPR